jgi:hypothetical protein
MIIHKSLPTVHDPFVSLLLLDWSVRERFQALDYLSRQTVPRDRYELIWIELYDRVIPEAMEKADMVMTCGQRGLYHKHFGYNTGLLQARGRIITICDSDAVFPPSFIESIIRSFEADSPGELRPLVLMHYQYRSPSPYPDEPCAAADLSRFQWMELWPNVGACMSVRKEDALRLGGFDEHESFRGYMCGPYDLGWRMVNLGIPEVWHDPSVALHHFAHPDPYATYLKPFTRKLWREIAHPHIDGHALKAVEAFSTGRLLPLKENPDIHALRMAGRQIGTTFEEYYGSYTDAGGFSPWAVVKIKCYLMIQYFTLAGASLLHIDRGVLKRIKGFIERLGIFKKSA